MMQVTVLSLTSSQIDTDSFSFFFIWSENLLLISLLSQTRNVDC